MFDQLQSHSDLSDKVEKKKTSSSSLHCRANRKQAQKFIFGSKLTNNNKNKNTTRTQQQLQQQLQQQQQQQQENNNSCLDTELGQELYF